MKHYVITEGFIRWYALVKLSQIINGYKLNEVQTLLESKSLAELSDLEDSYNDFLLTNSMKWQTFRRIYDNPSEYSTKLNALIK